MFSEQCVDQSNFGSSGGAFKARACTCPIETEGVHAQREAPVLVLKLEYNLVFGLRNVP